MQSINLPRGKAGFILDRPVFKQNQLWSCPLSSLSKLHCNASWFQNISGSIVCLIASPDLCWFQTDVKTPSVSHRPQLGSADQASRRNLFFFAIQQRKPKNRDWRMWLYISDLILVATLQHCRCFDCCLALSCPLAVKRVTHRISGPMMPSWLAKVFNSGFIFNLLFSCLLSLLTRGPPGWLVKANLWGLSYQWPWTSYPIKELDSFCLSNEPLIHDHWQSKEIFCSRVNDLCIYDAQWVAQ